ncbi:MAG: hypothetical protein HY042_12120 [Spirochaetia bacterium]|nr:hypothetical protein [Spirochaetia bacterium]
MKTGFRTVLTFFFTSAVVFFTAVASSTFALYWQTRSSVAEVLSLAQRRGAELGIALSTMATEQAGRDKGMVAMSAVFTDLVRLSKSRNEDFVVEEVFLLDSKGKLLAHNDVSKLAKDAVAASTAEYSKPEYSQVLNRDRRDPVVSRPLPADSSVIPTPREMILARILPGLTNVRAHIGVAVFQVDADFPTAGVHMIVSVKSMTGIIAGLTQSFLYALAVSAGASFVFSFLLTLIIYMLAIRHIGAKPSHARTELPAGVEFLEATATPVGHQQVTVAEPSRIMDAIPLDSH